MVGLDKRFVGRKAQRAAFKQRLHDPYDNERLEIILGQGGIGKTWLVKAMLEDAKTVITKRGQDYLILGLIDMYSTRHRHIEGVMMSIAARLQKEAEELFNEYFVLYQQTQAQLEKLRGLLDYSQEGLEVQLKAVQNQFLKNLSQFVQHKPTIIAFDTIELIYDTPVKPWLDRLTDDETMSGLICIIAGRSEVESKASTTFLSPLDDEEAINLYQQYGRGIWDDLPLSIEEKTWVQMLNQQSKGNPLLISLAINWLNETDFSLEELSQLSSTDFSREIIRYLSPIGSNRFGFLFPTIPSHYNKPVRQILVYAAYLNRRFNQQILQKLIEGKYITIDDGETLWQMIRKDISTLFYLKERASGNIQLHDILAEMIRIFILPTYFEDTYLGSIHSPILQKLAEEDVPQWYDEFIASAEENHQQQLLRVEKLAHILNTQIWIDTRLPEWENTNEAKTLARTLKPDFERGLALLEMYRDEHSDILDRFVINELSPEFVREFPPDLRYQACELLGEMARRIYDLPKAVGYWQIAVEAAQQSSNVEKQIEAIIGQHNSTWQTDLSQSLLLLQQAEHLCEQAAHLRPLVFYEIGFTYQEMHNLLKAVQWFDRAKTEAVRHKNLYRLAFILNDMGFAYSFMGEHTRAYILVDRARVIRQKRLNQIQGSYRRNLHDAQRYLGMTFNTLGLVLRYTSHFRRAASEHSEALHHFYNVKDYFWIMGALYERSDVNRAIAKALYDTEHKQAAFDYDQRAEEDIQQSLAICEKYGYVQELDTIHRRLGRLAHDRFFREDDPSAKSARLDEASAHFDQALAYAAETNDISEKLENLKEIAFLADDRIALTKANFPERLDAEITRAQINIQQLEENLEMHRQDEFRIYHLPVYENLLLTEKAALHYALGELDEALVLYVKGFTGLAQWPGYGVANYHALKEHLFNSIRNLGNPQLELYWCETLITAWRSVHMKGALIGADTIPLTIAEVTPDLVEWCRLHMEITFVDEESTN